MAETGINWTEVKIKIIQEAENMPEPVSPPALASQSAETRAYSALQNVFNEVTRAEVATTVKKTLLPKFFNPIFRKQNVVNRALIAALRASGAHLANLKNEVENSQRQIQHLTQELQRQNKKMGRLVAVQPPQKMPNK